MVKKEVLCRLLGHKPVTYSENGFSYTWCHRCRKLKNNSTGEYEHYIEMEPPREDQNNHQDRA